MSDGGQAQKGKSSQDEVEEVVEAPTGAEGAQDVLENVDDLLDEIDDVLEENAEEFVRSFVQKGGQ